MHLPEPPKLEEEQNHIRMQPLVVILGPTAVGKTEVSVDLAKRFAGEIVSADSRLLYRGMDIGTAKPTLQERKGVTHHLIDVADPDEVWSLADFQVAARQTIDGIISRGRLPFLVGGTGQYIRAITQAWDIPKVRPDPRLRQALNKWALEIGPDALHVRLSSVDPQAAASINSRNLRRIIRALEVIFTTGRLFSHQRNTGFPLYDVLFLGLSRPRDELYRRVDSRIERMIENGFVEEVRRLLDCGYSPEIPVFSAIGYLEIIAYVEGKMTLDEAVTLIKRKTRVFIRHQANWFKPDDPQIHWFRVSHNCVDDLESIIRYWLKGAKDEKV